VRRRELPKDALLPMEEKARLAGMHKKVSAVSHSWLKQGHADPKAIRKKDVAYFTGWGSPILWDFVSLFQLPRSKAESALFKDALQNMRLIYGNPQWRV